MTKRLITETQGRLLKFIAERISTQGYAPTVREMCEKFFWASTNAASTNLTALMVKGYVYRPPLKSRTIVLTDLAREWLDGQTVQRRKATGRVEHPWKCWSCDAECYHADTCAMCGAPRGHLAIGATA